MMRLYKDYFRLHGVRRLDQVAKPPVATLNEYELTKDSIIHYLRTGVELGPERNFLLLKGAKRGGWIEFVTQLTELDGKPRYHPEGTMGQINRYVHDNPMWRKLTRHIDSIDAAYPIIENYALLPDIYTYQTNQFTVWNQRKNLLATVVDNANNKAALTQKQQFLLLELDDSVPNINTLKHVEKSGIAQSYLKRFDSFSKFIILQLWIWLGENRSDSVFGKLTQQGVDYLNLVVSRNGVFTIINLGLINEWRIDPNNPDAERNGQKLTFDRLQKRILALFLTIGTGVTITGDVEDVLDTQDDQLATNLRNSPNKSKTDDDAVDEWLERQEANAQSAIEIDETTGEHVGGDTHVDLDAAVDDVLSAHETASDASVEVEPVIGQIADVTPYEPKEFSYANNALDKINKALRDGTISLPEYNRFVALANKHKEITLEGSDQTIVDFATVTSKMLAIESPPTIPDMPGVIDKSMLQSTHQVMRSRYIKDILDRDVMGAILAFQQTGCMVTKVTQTEHQDIGNHYRVYSVSLEMVDGVASTVQIKVPVFNEHGVCIAGGVKYYQKTQKGEDPIRKASSTRVALTSYYGKTFIDRLETVAYSPDRWLVNQITKLGIDKADTTVTNMRIGNVYVSNIKTPRIYSLLGNRFAKFTVSDIDFDFNPKTRFTVFGITPEDEPNGRIVVGKRSDGKLVFVDFNNQFYVDDQSIGTIENLIGIDDSAKPTEVATMTVFNKNIPVGVLLSYRLGLSKLIKTIQQKSGTSEYPRVVVNGKALGITKDEFRVKFKDYSLIFNKRDPMQALVFNGFNLHHKAIAQYPMALFDSPEVYFNVLSEANLGVRFLREIENVMTCFLDDIARGRLVEMGEPTDMVQLVLRACELLMTDYYNVSEGVRYRGYERVAGAVYSQLMMAYRKKRAKPFSSRSRLEINPEEIYMAIMLDSSMEVLNEINPIHELKNGEVVTYGGTGGRSTKTMVKRTRGYADSDLGVMSEATVDSGDVGILAFTSANPCFNSLRGTTSPIDENTGTSSFLSTSFLLAPSADGD